MNHRVAHPQDVPGCFGCKTYGVGFQGLKSALGADPVQTVPVVADDGPAAGTSVGAHRIHWDGRQDAVVKAPTTKVTTKTMEIR